MSAALDFDIADFVRRSRAAQGLEEKVTDQGVIHAVARLLSTDTRGNGSPKQGAVAQNTTSAPITATMTARPKAGSRGKG
jgi:hypothetical protein